MRRAILLYMIFFLLAGRSAVGQSAPFTRNYNDRILKFHSDITVLANGKLMVSELITIFNGNGQSNTGSNVNDDIKRGIMRRIPTDYVDKRGFWSKVGFILKGTYRNGEPEPYTTESTKNGINIRLGTANVLLPEGIHEYRIDYETDRQLIFHSDKDELYWNVNGSGWVFTVDTVSCLVRFPKGAVIKEKACYTSFERSRGENCSSTLINDSTVFFSTSTGLGSYSELTIAAAIQKGIITPPAAFDEAMAFARANYMVVILALLLVFLFCLYYVVWNRAGRDPAPGAIFPRHSPPAQLSPADMGYILNQSFESHLFTAAVLDFATKKQLEIEVVKHAPSASPTYHFKKPGGIDDPPSTRDVYGFNVESLYNQTIKRGTYNSTFKTCSYSLAETLKKRLLVRKGKPNTVFGAFIRNRSYTIFGAILVVAGIVGSIFFLANHPSRTSGITMLLLIVALIILQIVFSRIIGAYTPEGREAADQILGFKMYLEQAQQSGFENVALPEQNVELFEKYLPYAIALKVVDGWSTKFGDVMQGAINDGYQPAYYLAGYGAFNMHDMSSDLSSSLSNSISSVSIEPSSSGGGSSGGGSSGGGGGGGGGGGW